MKPLFLSLLFGLLAACSPTVAPIEPTRGEKTAVLPTATPAALASSVPPTSFPSRTPLPPPLPATITPALATPTPPPPPPPEKTLVWEALSPSGQWAAATSYEVPEGLGQFRTQFWVTNQTSGAVWLLLDELRPLGMGYTTPKVMGWAEDETAVFFSEAGQADGGGLFEYHHGLWRGSLLDGSVTEWVPADTADVAVAPGGETAVSVYWDRSDLLLHDLSSGTTEAVPLPAPFDLVGGLAWSPSGEQLALTLVVDPFDSHHTLVRYRRADWEPIILLADETTHRFVSERWLDEATLLLVAVDGRHWQLDVVSGEVTIVAE